MPPSPIGRAAVFSLALTWACLGKVDIVAVAPGKIIPSGRTKIIQPFETGVVRAIHVKAGQRVRAGDPLIDLDPAINAAEQNHLKADLLAAALDIARLKAELAAPSTKGAGCLWGICLSRFFQKLGLDGVELVLALVLQLHRRVARALGSVDQLVELQVQRLGVAVLRVLDQKHHQEGDDRRAGVDDQLPSIGPTEQRPGDRPDDEQRQRGDERRRLAGLTRHPLREPRERVRFHL